MKKIFQRGHYRWILPLFVLVMLVCISVASAADCAAGCSCLQPADAKAKSLSFCNGQQNICGYDQAKNAMYCYGSGITLVTPRITLIPVTLTTTAPPACPSGCECLTDPAATTKYGSYTRCTEQACGYEQVLTHVAAPIPKYCVKPLSPGTCPSGCECMFESAAKDKFGNYQQCSQTSCYSVVTGSSTINAYCFRPMVVSPVTCPSGCDCISDVTAKAKGGNWARCSADICGYEQSTATMAAVIQVPKYCMKQQPPVCPAGCSCILEEDAKQKELKKCDPNEAPCAYQPLSLTANTAGSGKPLYCYMTGVTTTVTPTAICPANCGCMSEAIAKEKLGTYKQCSEKICGYEPTATTANGIPQYCFGPGTTVTTTTLPPANTCAYDAQKNACTGSCRMGSPCTVISKEIGTVTAVAPPVCGCMATGCSFDYSKGACTGTCPITGEACQLNTLSRDAAGGISFAECHCKAGGDTTTVTPSVPCTCDPTRGSCTGNCPGGQSCWMSGTTMDNAGKALCTSCECKPTCTLDANNACSGTCPQGGACTTIVTKDDSGIEKVSCGCGGSATLVVPLSQAQQPDIVQSIGNFFKSLFGWK